MFKKKHQSLFKKKTSIRQCKYHNLNQIYFDCHIKIKLTSELEIK